MTDVFQLYDCDVYPWAKAFQGLGSNASNSLQFFDGPKRTMVLAVFNNSGCQAGTDTRQELQIFQGRGVDVDLVAFAQSCNGCAAWPRLVDKLNRRMGRSS